MFAILRTPVKRLEVTLVATTRNKARRNTHRGFRRVQSHTADWCDAAIQQFLEYREKMKAGSRT
jgi:hypothetical protein